MLIYRAWLFFPITQYPTTPTSSNRSDNIAGKERAWQGSVTLPSTPYWKPLCKYSGLFSRLHKSRILSVARCASVSELAHSKKYPRKFTQELQVRSTGCILGKKTAVVRSRSCSGVFWHARASSTIRDCRLFTLETAELKPEAEPCQARYFLPFPSPSCVPSGYFSQAISVRNCETQPGKRGEQQLEMVCGFWLCRDLEVLKFLSFALKRKFTLSERSEFVNFRFVFSKNQEF